MKYLDEYRNEKYVKILAEDIAKVCTKSWKIMEVCGGQTHNIVKYGLQQLLPPEIELLHGPGCPVCVTPIEIIDQAIAISQLENTILCTFGDMLRVPGSVQNLLYSKAQGADIRIVYSPLDVIKIAKDNTDKEVVFFAVGFETTAPATAMLIDIVDKKNILNLSVLISNVRVPPVLEVLLDDCDCSVNGFLAAGNVCTVMGEKEYLPIVEKYKVPIVITGFEPVDIMAGIKACVTQLEKKEYALDNRYKRSVKKNGNQYAQDLLFQIFHICDSNWRGLGVIPLGGFVLQDKYTRFDASWKFNQSKSGNTIKSNCLAGDVLLGKIKPNKCPAFGVSCNPGKPLGAPMVSMEGACHAYYLYNS